MYSGKNLTLALLCACALLLTGAATLHARTERGLPLLTVHRSEEHKGGPQTWEMAQDARGVLYFGNLAGILSYDGAWWRLLELPDQQAALALANDASGRIAVGLVNDLGYLSGDATGSLEYRSLLRLVPENARAFGDVRGVCATPNGFLFVTETNLLAWEGERIRVVSTHTAADGPRRCRADGPRLFLTGPQGLRRLDLRTNRIEPAGIDARVSTAIPRGDGSVVAVVRDQGLVEVRDGVAAPFAPAASAWLKGKLISGGCRLFDGRLVVTTRQHGLLLLAPNGEIETIITDAAGLPDAILAGAFTDREGSLWLPMEGPIVRMDVSTPVSLFDARLGLRGSASDVVRHDGRVYATSSHGLFVFDERGAATQVEGIVGGAWKLLSIDNSLLIATTRGPFVIENHGPPRALSETELEVYDFHRSPSDPSRVWMAVRYGIGSLRRDANGIWRNEPVIKTGREYHSNVVEHGGALWCGTVFDGVLRVEPGPKPKVVQYGSGEMNAAIAGGRVIVIDATHGRMLRATPEGRLEPDPLLGHIHAPRGFFVIAEDGQGNVWINSTPPRVVAKTAGGKYAAEGQPLVSVSATDIQNLRATPDGLVWFASDKGLFRYEPSSAPTTVPPPAAIVRRVVAGEDRLLFGGMPSLRDEPVHLKHDFRRIRIEFAPASYRPGVMYQYRLDPIDAWSGWTTEPFIDFTTLGAGDYTFRLRARGAATAIGPETLWYFTVLPPWYRTSWAYLLWIVAAVALVALLIRMRTHALRRQAERLQARVDAQTAQLQQTVELLEQANERLEALSLADDLTGVANRRYFQRALSDEWNRARRREQPLALILLDLDSFKQLNDRRGHPAGDACLQRVGRFLAETIRRSGEVVARYGGEEFAILLPAVDVHRAIVVAESLRDGIERLSIPYDHSARRMTASCGVAAMIPTSDMAPEDLVAAADRALYAAKHSGRNCVRTPEDAEGGTTWLRDVSAS